MKNKKKKIVVIGSSNVDLIMQMDHLPKPGETVLGGVFNQTYGGKGANQAVGAARSGADVSFISALGDDGFAPDFVANFKKDQIDVSRISFKKGFATGTALIMIDKNGENCISVAPGANNELKPEEIDAAEAILAEAEMILLQCEIHPQTLRYIIRKASDMNKKLLLNLAPAISLEAEYLAPLEWLIVNESEASFLVGRSVETAQEMESAVHELEQRVKGGVILTLGSKGSFIARGATREHVAAFSVQAVDTTAAGDIYCGSLATALAEDKTIREAVRFASAAAAIAVTRLGAQPSAPSRIEIEEFLSGQEI